MTIMTIGTCWFAHVPIVFKMTVKDSKIVVQASSLLLSLVCRLEARTTI